MNAVVDNRTSVQPDFEDIYRVNYRKVRNLCAYLLNSGSAAEDAAHEVFLRVQRKINSYNPDYSISNWILKIASNYCVDLLRKRGREKQLFIQDPADTTDPFSDRPSPIEQILTFEKGQTVRQALVSLNEKLRIPLILSFYNDFSYDEIASVLNISRNTVATLLFRGKRQLRDKLKKESYHAMP